jgi:putative oxidoreductase
MQTLPASTAAALANRWAPEALSLLRIVSAWLVLLHGSAKLLGWPKIDMFANVQ